MPRLRGAIPSPRHKLAASTPHRVIGVTPDQWLWKPAKVSMWLNDTYGDCVTAEEAFNKACNLPEIFISDAEVIDWATRNDVLNGADLSTVLEAMQAMGFEQGGYRYNDGQAQAVDWTNDALLRNAIVQGPVKIGVAADQLQVAVPEPPANGWLATGFAADANLDHCVSLCGYGVADWLAAQLGVMVPSTLKSVPAYAMFTWDSIGIIDVPSMLAITGEAWLRVPGTITLALDGVNSASLYGG